MGISRRRDGIGQPSLSTFSRLSSSAEHKESGSERRKRKKELLEKELDDESDITLSEDGSEEKDSGSLESFATGVLSGSRSRQQGSGKTRYADC
jgi:hypothetical protein